MLTPLACMTMMWELCMLQCPESRCSGNQVGALGMHNVNTGSDVYARGCLAVAVNGIQQDAMHSVTVSFLCVRKGSDPHVTEG